ncbi:DUF6301 family protein [Nocardia salmonicida]|uniref:DUF6301 family protein n=1 Tax=Nocardia salmonicida TaxID=53431 RepID=UPI0033F958FF
MVDHISYLRTSMNSIPEGYSTGIWFVGEDIAKLGEYINLFTAPPRSVPDILVLSQMVDMARKRSVELAATVRRSTNRRKTEQRIAAKVCIASKFDWTWTFDNIRRFCEIVGWHEDSDPENSYSIEGGGDLNTDIDVRQPGASLSVRNGDIRYCSFKAIDTVSLRDADGDVTAERMLEEFNNLADVIESLIGSPLRRFREIDQTSEIAWMFPKVVIRLRRSTQGFRVWMMNPRYLAEFDGNFSVVAR